MGEGDRRRLGALGVSRQVGECARGREFGGAGVADLCYVEPAEKKGGGGRKRLASVLPLRHSLRAPLGWPLPARHSPSGGARRRWTRPELRLPRPPAELPGLPASRGPPAGWAQGVARLLATSEGWAEGRARLAAGRGATAIDRGAGGQPGAAGTGLQVKGRARGGGTAPPGPGAGARGVASDRRRRVRLAPPTGFVAVCASGCVWACAGGCARARVGCGWVRCLPAGLQEARLPGPPQTAG